MRPSLRSAFFIAPLLLPGCVEEDPRTASSTDGPTGSSGPQTSDGGSGDAGTTGGGDAGNDESGSSGDTGEPLGECDPTDRAVNRWVTADAIDGGSGTEDDPWSLADAMRLATAGDVVELAPGIYEGEHTSSRYLAAFQPTASGTTDAPIVFVARHRAATCDDPSLITELRTNATTNDGNTGSPTFGVFGQDYVIFDGFFVDEANAHLPHDSGLAVLWETTGSQILNSRFQAEPVQWEYADNHSMLRLEQSLDLAVRGNVLTGVGQGETGENAAAGLIAYNVAGAEIAHNLVESTSSAIYPKGDQAVDPMRLTDWRIHHNIIRDANKAVFVGAVNSGTDEWIDIHNNVAYDVRNFLWVVAYDPTTPHNVRVVNNTFVRGAFGEGTLYFQGDPTIFEGDYVSFSDIIFRNNIIADSVTGFGTYIPAEAFNRIDPDYNLYFEVGGGYPYVEDLGAWQALGKDVNSMFVDPLFVDPDAGDFRLSESSPARGAGVDVFNQYGGGPIDMGAYVTGDSDTLGPR